MDSDFGYFFGSGGSCRFQLISVKGKVLDIKITEVDGLNNISVGEKYTLCTDWAINDERSILTLSGCSIPGILSGTVALKDWAYE